MTKLAYGLGFRATHYTRIVDEGPTAADFYEVISENFMTAGGRPRRFLAGLRERYPVAAHGVSLSIAGPDPLDAGYLKALRDFIRWLRPAFVSDHLCWTGRAHQNAHDLLPLPFTEASLTHVAARVHAAQERLDTRLYLENPSAYVAFAGDTMDEATYLAELTRRTGCGLLLDVNNLFVNTMNLAYDPISYLRALPAEAVGYFHLAGHCVNPDVRIDTHDDHVCPEVWALYGVAAKLFPHAPTLVEWDDKIPPFEELEAELDLARRHRQSALNSDLFSLTSAAITAVAAALRPTRLAITTPRIDLSAPQTALTQNTVTVQDAFLDMTAQKDNVAATDERLSLFAQDRPADSLRGINVYNNAYFFRIRDVLMDELTTVVALLGNGLFEATLARYLTAYPSTSYDIKFVGRHLPEFLAEQDSLLNGHDTKGLAALTELELTRFELYDVSEGPAALTLEALGATSEAEWPEATFAFRPCVRLLDLPFSVTDAWDAAQDGETPPSPAPTPSLLLVFRHDEDVYHNELSPAEALAFSSLAAGGNFEAACLAYGEASGCEPDEAIAGVIKLLADWTTLGLIAAP